MYTVQGVRYDLKLLLIDFSDGNFCRRTFSLTQNAANEKRHLLNSHCMKSDKIRSYFWSAFSRIRTEYGEILRISPYLVQMRENVEQKKSEFVHFSKKTAR